MTDNDDNFPKIPKEAIVKPEDQKQTKNTIKPEEVESKDEAEYERMKSVDHDMDGDDNPDFDPAA
jgi:hypothetical protein